jgi:hypothetical protein
MEPYEPARAGQREWKVNVEELGLATFHDLEMARPLFGPTSIRILSAAVRVRDPDRPASERDGPGPRSRPGKRW